MACVRLLLLFVITVRVCVAENGKWIFFVSFLFSVHGRSHDILFTYLRVSIQIVAALRWARAKFVVVDILGTRTLFGLRCCSHRNDDAALQTVYIANKSSRNGFNLIAQVCRMSIYYFFKHFASHVEYRKLLQKRVQFLSCACCMRRPIFSCCAIEKSLCSSSFFPSLHICCLILFYSNALCPNVYLCFMLSLALCRAIQTKSYTQQPIGPTDTCTQKLMKMKRAALRASRE